MSVPHEAPQVITCACGSQQFTTDWISVDTAGAPVMFPMPTACLHCHLPYMPPDMPEVVIKMGGDDE